MTKQAMTPVRTPINPLIVLVALFFLSACSSPPEANAPPPDVQEFDTSNTDTGHDASSNQDTTEDTAQNIPNDVTQDVTENDAPDAEVDNRCDTDCGHGTCIKVDGIDTCECNPGFHPDDLYCRADACQGDDCPMSVTVSGLSGASQITVGNEHTCALLGDKTTRCWGGNRYGQMGDGTTTDRHTPTLVVW